MQEDGCLRKPLTFGRRVARHGPLHGVRSGPDLIRDRSCRVTNRWRRQCHDDVGRLQKIAACGSFATPKFISRKEPGCAHLPLAFGLGKSHFSSNYKNLAGILTMNSKRNIGDTGKFRRSLLIGTAVPVLAASAGFGLLLANSAAAAPLPSPFPIIGATSPVTIANDLDCSDAGDCLVITTTGEGSFIDLQNTGNLTSSGGNGIRTETTGSGSWIKIFNGGAIDTAGIGILARTEFAFAGVNREWRYGWGWPWHEWVKSGRLWRKCSGLRRRTGRSCRCGRRRQYPDYKRGRRRGQCQWRQSNECRRQCQGGHRGRGRKGHWRERHWRQHRNDECRRWRRCDCHLEPRSGHGHWSCWFGR